MWGKGKWRWDCFVDQIPVAALAHLVTTRGRWNFVAGMSAFLRADGQVPASGLVRSGPQTQRPSTSGFRRPGHEGRMPLPTRPSSARPGEGMRIAGQKQCGQVLTGWEMSREGAFRVPAVLLAWVPQTASPYCMSILMLPMSPPDCIPACCRCFVQQTQDFLTRWIPHEKLRTKN